MDRPPAPYPAILAALAIAAAATALGCAPSIGDRCNISTDCSIQGNRLCDTSQPGGYCTVGACTAGSCPDNATCVQFGASLPGCPYDDYQAPSRTGRSLCMKTCSKDSDCRQSDGYVCVPPSEVLGAVILESNQSAHVCMLPATPVPLADADVCSTSRPDVPPIEASVELVPDAAGDGAGGEGGDGAAAEGGEEGDGGAGALDGAGGAGDAGALEGGASEAGADDGGGDATAAPVDATLDASAADAPFDGAE